MERASFGFGFGGGFEGREVGALTLTELGALTLMAGSSGAFGLLGFGLGSALIFSSPMGGRGEPFDLPFAYRSKGLRQFYCTGKSFGMQSLLYSVAQLGWLDCSAKWQNAGLPPEGREFDPSRYHVSPCT